MEIKVIVHTPDSPDMIGAIHARHGRPIEVRITRDIMTEVMHLSAEEALSVAKEITDNVSLEEENSPRMFPWHKPT